MSAQVEIKSKTKRKREEKSVDIDYDVREIHEERLQIDPIYRLLLEPNSIVENSIYIDTLLALCIKYLYKLYGTDFIHANSVLEKVYALLLTTSDNDVKTFTIIFFLQWEPALREEVKKMYKDSPYHLNGGTNQFFRFMTRMEDNIAKTLHFPFDKYNIFHIVTNFCRAARHEYIMGPTI